MASSSVTTTVDQRAELKRLGKKRIIWPKVEGKYKISRLLGSGSFAKVYLCKHKKEKKQYAMKILEKEQVDLRRLAFEIQILETLKHEHIMGFKEHIETKRKVVLVCELATGGELLDRIIEKEAYSELEAVAVVRQLLEGLEYAHAMGVIHRDLKPENLLLVSRRSDTDIKISDFGLAKMLDDSYVASTLCGTPMYVAPELLEPDKQPYGPKVDLWAVGCITFFLLGGYPPFYDDNLGVLYRKILEVDYAFEDEYWRDVSGAAKNFIESLLVSDPEQRLDAAQALQHPWLQPGLVSSHKYSDLNLARLREFVQREKSASQSRLQLIAEQELKSDEDE